MQTPPPTVNFGLLEDLLEEAKSDRRAEKLVEVRVTTTFTTRSGGGAFGDRAPSAGFLCEDTLALATETIGFPRGGPGA